MEQVRVKGQWMRKSTGRREGLLKGLEREKEGERGREAQKTGAHVTEKTKECEEKEKKTLVFNPKDLRIKQVSLLHQDYN